VDCEEDFPNRPRRDKRDFGLFSCCPGFSSCGGCFCSTVVEDAGGREASSWRGSARGLGVSGRSEVGLWRSCSTIASSIESQSGYSNWGESREGFCGGGFLRSWFCGGAGSEVVEGGAGVEGAGSFWLVCCGGEVDGADSCCTGWVASGTLDSGF
jgi:hypothetical protein